MTHTDNDTQLYFSFQQDDPMHASQTDGYLAMYERTSPIAQPNKDRSSHIPCHLDCTELFHHPARLINNNPIKFSQKSWGNLCCNLFLSSTTSQRYQTK